MQIVFPKSAKTKKATRGKREDVEAAESSLIHVQNAPNWEDLNVPMACAHVGPFLEYLKNNHSSVNPPFQSRLLEVMDESDADQTRAVASLRSLQSAISFTDILALLGPAVEYAIAISQGSKQLSAAEIEKFVISLVLALAEGTSASGTDKLAPLDDDLVAGITVTIRNIMLAYQKDFSKINYVEQVSFLVRISQRLRCCACIGTGNAH